MIKIVKNETGCEPMFVCDICGKWIDDAHEAMVLHPRPFPENARAPRAVPVVVMHIHKGSCVQSAKSCGSGGDIWDEMTNHLAQLVHNCGLTAIDICPLEVIRD